MSQTTSEGHFKDWFKKEKSFDAEYKDFSIKNPLKNSF
jgi:hypothetical protein